MGVVKRGRHSMSGFYKYDVFLCLNDSDGLTYRLYGALSKFRIFRPGPTDTREAIERAIKESMVSIIVCTDRYMSSEWHLNVLALVLQRKRTHAHRIIPVFYHADGPCLEDCVDSKFSGVIHALGNADTRWDNKKKWRTDLVNKLEEWRKNTHIKRSVLEGMSITQYICDVEVIEDKQDFSGGDLYSVQFDMFASVIYLMNSELSELPKKPCCHFLVELFLQLNPDLTEIPLTFFEEMPILQVLDLSNTSIKSLPPSISCLVKLREFYLRGCELLMELIPEIGALGNLKVLDLEGTPLICLPKEIRGLPNLECLKVSLCRGANHYRQLKGIQAIIPREETLSGFSHLKELSIDVDPDCEWWDIEVEAILNEQYIFTKLEMLKLYLPTVELLQQLWQVRWMSNFRLIVGRHEKLIISSIPHDLRYNFEKLANCLIYVNGEGNHDVIAMVLKCATTLFLDRHWTIERLSVFEIDEMTQLANCLLVECSEMKTIIDGGDFYQQGGDGEIRPVLEQLEYLSIHRMNNLESIWRGPIVSGCLSNLTTLALHACPKLSTIFNLEFLGNLIRLKQLIVEDCPKIKNLVSFESSHKKPFLWNLWKISLIRLPELDSISSGVWIAPKLERLVIYNCPKLKSLSPMERSSKHMKEIKGKSAWWKALEWNIPEWSSDQYDYLVSLFVPFGRDGDLMDELAEAVQTSLNS